MTASDVAAMPAGREMDAIVAEKVMGYERLTCDDFDGVAILWPAGDGLVGKASWRVAPAGTPLAQYGYAQPGRYSTDIAAAWEVLARFADRGVRVDNATHAGGWYCEIGLCADRETYEFGRAGETAPEAICKAALLAAGGSP